LLAFLRTWMQGPIIAHGGYESNAVVFSSYPASPAIAFKHHQMSALKTNWPATSAEVDGVSPISVEGPQDPWTSSNETGMSTLADDLWIDISN
jgi:hypothetical protein